LQPHRIRTFTFSPDPEYEAKLLDIVGLYLNPPENAKDFLLEFIANYVERCTPFRWTKGPEKLQRIIEAANQHQATHPRQPKSRRRPRQPNNTRN
jgi:hypothetical protein